MTEESPSGLFSDEISDDSFLAMNFFWKMRFRKTLMVKLDS
jgi:hypothetical protein